MKTRWLLWLVLFTGCDEDQPPADPYARGSLQRAADFPGTPDDEATHAGLFVPTIYGDPVCDAVPRDLEKRREIRIFYHPSQADLITKTTWGLSSYFQRYGIEFFTRHAPQPLPLDWLVDLDQVRLTQHLRDRFPDVDFSSSGFEGTEEELDLIYTEAFEFTFTPLMDFVRAYGDQGEDITNLVLLPQVMFDNERFPPRPGEPGVLGMAMSPALLERFNTNASTEEAHFWRYFPVRGSFTPMMFVNTGLLQKLVDRGIHAVIFNLVVAHEFGHTLGLEHVNALSNLMYPSIGEPSQFDCGAELVPDQLVIAETTLDGSMIAQALSVPEPSGPIDRWSRLRNHLIGQGKSPFQPSW